MRKDELIIQRFRDSIAVKEQNIKDEVLMKAVSDVSEKLISTLKNGNKTLLCGNGGSASDALHFAGEIVGRFQKDRSAWPAVVLNSDVASMTAISNDYGFEEVYSRQAEAYVRPGDMFIGISTSGNSENVLRAARVAKERGAVTVALLGNDGGKIKNEVDYPIIVRCNNTARVQESHICIIHIICELVEEALG